MELPKFIIGDEGSSESSDDESYQPSAMPLMPAMPALMLHIPCNELPPRRRRPASRTLRRPQKHLPTIYEVLADEPSDEPSPPQTSMIGGANMPITTLDQPSTSNVTMKPVCSFNKLPSGSITASELLDSTGKPPPESVKAHESLPGTKSSTGIFQKLKGSIKACTKSASCIQALTVSRVGSSSEARSSAGKCQGNTAIPRNINSGQECKTESTNSSSTPTSKVYSPEFSWIFPSEEQHQMTWQGTTDVVRDNWRVTYLTVADVRRSTGEAEPRDNNFPSTAVIATSSGSRLAIDPCCYIQTNAMQQWRPSSIEEEVVGNATDVDSLSEDDARLSDSS